MIKFKYIFNQNFVRKLWCHSCEHILHGETLTMKQNPTIDSKEIFFKLNCLCQIAFIE